MAQVLFGQIVPPRLMREHPQQVPGMRAGRVRLQHLAVQLLGLLQSTCLVVFQALV
jgi:hypothetical protein